MEETDVERGNVKNMNRQEEGKKQDRTVTPRTSLDKQNKVNVR